MNEHQTPPDTVKIGGLSVTHGWASDLRALASQIIDRVIDGETRAYVIAEMIAKHCADMPTLGRLSAPEADAFVVGWNRHRCGHAREDIEASAAVVAGAGPAWVAPEKAAAAHFELIGWDQRQSRLPNDLDQRRGCAEKE